MDKKIIRDTGEIKCLVIREITTKIREEIHILKDQVWHREISPTMHHHPHKVGTLGKVLKAIMIRE